MPIVIPEVDVPYMTVQSYFGLGFETTRGTAASSLTYIPIDSPQLTPNLAFGKDEGYRGSPVENYGNVPLNRHDEFECKGKLFADTFPLILRGVLGSTDTVTGTAAPYQHVFGLLNNATGSQPPSATLVDFDGAAARQMLAGQGSELSISFAADAAVEWSGKWVTNAFSNITAPTETFSSEIFVPAWSTAITIGGTGSNTVVSADVDIKREAAPIYTIGQQSSYRNFADKISVDGKLSFVLESGDTTLTSGLSRTPQAIVLTLTEPVSSHSVALQMSQVQFTEPKVTRGKPYPMVEVNFTAEGNATDAVNGGFSPIKATIQNGKASAY